MTQQEAEQDALNGLSLGELLAVVASEASEHPYVGSVRQKQAWDEIKRRDAVAVRERDQARDALREADRILEWWHGTFEPHTRRSWDYNACEPCRPIRDQIRAALAGDER